VVEVVVNGSSDMLADTYFLGREEEVVVVEVVTSRV